MNKISIRTLLSMVAVFLFISTAEAASQFVNFQNHGIPIINNGTPVDIMIDKQEVDGVVMAVENLSEDFKRVCGMKARITITKTNATNIIIGSINTPLMKSFIRTHKIDSSELKGKNEKFILTTIDNDVIIVGSDKRGTIYGIYELSKQMGVSPWYWWMDVPIEHHENVFVKAGTYTDGEPKVKYRGIFINDEHPAFHRWSREKFAYTASGQGIKGAKLNCGENSRCYKLIFELLLRLKANFMWPAMWGNAFYDDDPENGPLANKMGIIMGTSHHEPMCLAQQDWKRRRNNISECNGEWDYVRNEKGLQNFWRTGIERAKEWEKVVTIGMRGDGDMAMDGFGDIKLMEKIIADQRAIIKDVTKKPLSETPQLWALYKEVQTYYDKGMNAPDDVILLLCDDNWGNVRRLPDINAVKHPGGYGMYYHVDYVGVPRNSKWINISPISRIWEQMNLTYRHGVDKLWVLNVGDLKPMEYPITFFLDMAWNPDLYMDSIGSATIGEKLIQHSIDFCKESFGEDFADEAARQLRLYAKYNRRVTPELLDSKTFSIDNYGEFERVTAAYNQLAIDTKVLGAKIPEKAQSAWFQLLGYPIQAMSNLYNMYYAQAMNQKLYKQYTKNQATSQNEKLERTINTWADRVVACYKKDSLLSLQYNSLNDGKWNHMMDEIHIGYKSWNNPKKQECPEVFRIEGTDGMFEYLDLPTPCPEVYATIGDAPTFMEKSGYVSIEAEHFTRKTDGREAHWTVIPEMGRTLSSILPMPATAAVDGMSLEYDIDITKESKANVILRFYATLNFNKTGLRYVVQIDDQAEQVINLNGHYDGEIGQWQQDHIIDSKTYWYLTPGKHTLRFSPLDNNLVLEKIMIDLGGLKKSFLGPQETIKKLASPN